MGYQWKYLFSVAVLSPQLVLLLHYLHMDSNQKYRTTGDYRGTDRTEKVTKKWKSILVVNFFFIHIAAITITTTTITATISTTTSSSTTASPARSPPSPPPPLPFLGPLLLSRISAWLELFCIEHFKWYLVGYAPSKKTFLKLVKSRQFALNRVSSVKNGQSTVCIEPCKERQEWPVVFTSETSVHSYVANDSSKTHLTITETYIPFPSCILYYLHEALYNLFIFPFYFLIIPDFSLFE